MHDQHDLCEKEPKNEVVCYIHGIGTSEGLEIAYNDKIKCFLTFGNWLKSKIGHLFQNFPTFLAKNENQVMVIS